MKKVFIDPTWINAIKADLCQKIPGGAHILREDLEKNLHAVLQASFAKLDLVTREEFDIQTKVLARCRKRIAELEAKILYLDQLAAHKNAK